MIAFSLKTVHSLYDNQCYQWEDFDFDIYKLIIENRQKQRV